MIFSGIWNYNYGGSGLLFFQMCFFGADCFRGFWLIVAGVDWYYYGFFCGFLWLLFCQERKCVFLSCAWLFVHFYWLMGSLTTVIHCMKASIIEYMSWKLRNFRFSSWRRFMDGQKIKIVSFRFFMLKSL